MQQIERVPEFMRKYSDELVFQAVDVLYTYTPSAWHTPDKAVAQEARPAVQAEA
jgi:hypothetical protein